MKKRAFTLYEIAVVLVVIGIIAAMLIKGGAIIRVAEFKHEGLKIESIRYALATFEKRNGRLPGDETNVGIIDRGLSVQARQELIDAGLITDTEFKISFDMDKMKPAILDFRRCISTGDGTYTLLLSGPGVNDNEASEIGANRGQLCLAVCRIYEDGIADADMRYDILKHYCTSVNQQTPKGIVGGYEMYFDDGTLGGGFGRIANSTAPSDGSISIYLSNKDQREKLRDYFVGKDLNNVPLFQGYYLIKVWP